VARIAPTMTNGNPTATPIVIGSPSTRMPSTIATRRVDVGDHGRATGSGLRHEGEQHQERDGGAQHRQAGDRQHRRSGGPRRVQPYRERQIGGSGDDQRTGDDTDRRQVVEHMPDEVGTERVADSDQYHRDDGAEVRQIQVEADQGSHPAEADDQADDPTRGEAIVSRDRQQHGGEERDHRHQQAGG
jgi:hypothetical protein